MARQQAIAQQRAETAAAEKRKAKFMKMRANSVAMSCEVWEVIENGIIIHEIKWMKGNGTGIHKEEGLQFIDLGDTDDFEVYEGLNLDVLVIPEGTVRVDGRRYKRWVFVPGPTGRSFPSKYR
jgi:hypothetical protein